MTIFDIKDLVENYFGLSIGGSCRKRDIVDARRMYGMLCRDKTTYKLHAIGSAIDRDHSSIVHYIKSGRYLIENDKDFRETWFNLLKHYEERKVWVSSTTLPIVPKYLLHPARFRGHGKSLREVLIKRGSSTTLSYTVSED